MNTYEHNFEIYKGGLKEKLIEYKYKLASLQSWSEASIYFS